MIGAAFALAAALSWAGSSAILKSLTAKVDTLSLSILRLCVASLFLLIIISISGRITEFTNVPWVSLAYLIVGGIIALAIGDPIYLKSLSFLNVSQAFPIAQCSNPVFTMLLAVSLLGEPITWVTGLGAFLVLLGIYLITSTPVVSSTSSTVRSSRVKGIVLAVTAGVMWAIAAITIKLGTVDVDPLVAAFIRQTSASIVLLPIALSRRKKGALQLRRYGSRNLALTFTSGIIDYGMGMVFFIIAVQLIGAGKAVVLGSTSPLLLLPFSVFILKEKLTRLTLLGIFIGVAGICLVAI